MSNPAVSKGFPIGLRVLVVDDDPLCLKIVEKMLKRCQYEGACLARHTRPVIGNLPIGTRISLGTRGVETAMERLTSDRIAAGSALKRCIRVFQKYLARFPNRPALAAPSRPHVGNPRSTRLLTSHPLSTQQRSHHLLARCRGAEDPARAQGRLRHRALRRAHAGHGWLQALGAHRARARHTSHE